MRMFLKLLFTFAPWLCFLLIARGSMFRLELGIVVGLILSVIMGVARVNRGVILWVGLGFFAYALVAVVLLHDLSATRHMGVLANGALAVATWLTMAVGKPFTLDYAREQTDPSHWNSPAFLKTNYLLTGLWGAVFTVNAALALYSDLHPELPASSLDIASYALMLAALAFTSWYPDHVKEQLRALAASGAEV